MSTSPEIAIIVAVARNRVIGDGSGMPWHLPGQWPIARPFHCEEGIMNVASSTIARRREPSGFITLAAGITAVCSVLACSPVVGQLDAPATELLAQARATARTALGLSIASATSA